MKSKVAVTYELDDLDLAAEELANSINNDFPLLKNTCGIIFCESDMEQKDFVQKLKQRFPFDIIGCTGIATIDRTEGFNEMCITFLVLTADDCDFSVALSEAITPENVTEQVEKTYKAVEIASPDKIKLLIALPPYNLNIMLDEFANALDKVAVDVPIFGGLPSYRAEGDHNMTIFNDSAFTDKLVLLAISGNVKPVFSIQTVKASAVERKRKITSSKRNTVYTVGDQRFTDYMKEIGLPVEELAEGNNTIAFLSNPILVEHVKRKNSEDFSFVRTLHKIDVKEGSGTAIGEIPQGATLSICSLKREEIAEAAFAGMKNLKEQMAKTDYDFSTVFVVSCIGRYLLMSPNSHIEAANLIKEMPDGVNLCGFYSYGEISPLFSEKNEITTFAHNESMILCAF